LWLQKKVLQLKKISPLSFAAVFGSGIRDKTLYLKKPDRSTKAFYTVVTVQRAVLETFPPSQKPHSSHKFRHQRKTEELKRADFRMSCVRKPEVELLDSPFSRGFLA
jgi:hypothetical protein